MASLPVHTTQSSNANGATGADDGTYFVLSASFYAAPNKRDLVVCEAIRFDIGDGSSSYCTYINAVVIVMSGKAFYAPKSTDNLSYDN